MTNTLLPYKIMALAPFAPVPEEKFKPEFVPVDLHSIDTAIEKISPVLYIPLPAELCLGGAVTLKLKRIKDFKPASIIKNNPGLSSLSKGEESAPVTKAKKVISSKENISIGVITPILSLFF